MVMFKAVYYFGFGGARLSGRPPLVACHREGEGVSLSVLLWSIFLG